jgi:hypothetical protein
MSKSTAAVRPSVRFQHVSIATVDGTTWSRSPSRKGSVRSTRTSPPAAKYDSISRAPGRINASNRSNRSFIIACCFASKRSRPILRLNSVPIESVPEPAPSACLPTWIAKRIDAHIADDEQRSVHVERHRLYNRRISQEPCRRGWQELHRDYRSP